jgi:signal transduction histidine kinase
MERVLQTYRSLLRFKHLPSFVIAFTLAVFATTIWTITRQLRSGIREQIVRRDAEILHAVALMHQFDDPEELGARIEEPADQFVLLVETSRLKRVIAARLYSGEGDFVSAFPDDVAASRLADSDLRQLRSLRPLSHYEEEAYPSRLFKAAPLPAGLQEPSAPLLNVLVPLHRHGQNQLLGIAQFILDGQDIAAEFAALDRHLYLYASAAFGGGTLIIVAALIWAFRRLQQTNRVLQVRTANLLNANHELALAAKTSALGAVTAHLIHGLRSPLSGLQTFVANRDSIQPARDDSEWQSAVETTRRMQIMISDIVRVLNEHDGLSRYEVTLTELMQMISARTLPAAREARVDLRVESNAEGILVSRDANLILLILENLIHNAIHASPAGGTVTIRAIEDAGAVVCEVRDQGPGFPEPLRSSLFVPCRSSKEGGSGIGLAISKQLAGHLGAGLELKSSSAGGCAFALSLPPELLARASANGIGRVAVETVSQAGRA